MSPVLTPPAAHPGIHLAQLRAENFRLFERFALNLHPRLNIFVGVNAAGKTSLLEAAYTVGRGRSFRGTSPAELAGQAGRRWWCAGQIRSPELPGRSIAVRWAPQGTRLRLGGMHAPTVADLVRALPVQVLEPGMHRLLQEGPAYRRSFLDWGVFHVEHQFHAGWRRFQRALRQRNAALRQQASAAQVRSWDGELAVAGEALGAWRAKHVDAIRPEVGRRIGEFLGPEPWGLELHPGWSGESYAAVLAAQLERDRRQGTTVEGPHRAELRVRLSERPVKNRISRGQQKLLIAALLLAQAEEIRSRFGRAPLLLVDDFSAELADTFQQRLFSALQRYPGQVLLTSFEATGVLASASSARMFHVEQGSVRPA